MSDTNNNSIITVETKENPMFQRHLAALARSDAHHDLKKEFTYKMYDNPSIKAAFNSGIPVPANTVYHEALALAASIIRAGPLTGTMIPVNVPNPHQAETNLKNALDTVFDCTSTPITDDKVSIFETGFGETTIFKYKVAKFVIACSNNTAAMKPGACSENFGKRFVQNTKLGEENLPDTGVALIVDFSQHHFMQKLVDGDPHAFNIHYLMTPEVVNDPAGKPNIHNAALFNNNNKGVRLISYIQAGSSQTSYTGYDKTNPSPANNFFSNYNFTLSSIKQSFIKGKAQNLISTLDIDYDDGNKTAPPLSDTITDSKGENSVTTVLGYLKDVIKKITKSGASFNRVDAFSFNSKCQQKRGGDWFQVLSCIDVKNRNFTRILPTLATGDTADKPLPPCPVYLVTHDQIAVSYALLNGVNVIYIDYYGNIYVFKNTADPTLKGSGKPMEEILFDGLKVAWPTPKEIGFVNPIEGLLTYGNTYTRDRNNYLDVMKTNFKTNCARISTFLAVPANIDTIGRIQITMTDQMQRLFREAVTLMFAQMNLVDISAECIVVNDYKYILDENTSYDATNNSIINNLSNSINNIQSVKNRFGNIESASSLTFETAFATWITKTVEKLDVYKTANNILSGGKDLAEPKTFMLSRLVSFFNSANQEERKTDSHIFLPFIQSLDIDSRQAIKAVLTTAISVTENYGRIMSATPERTSRNGSMSPNQLYFNKMGNLIQEALIFVITDIESGDKYNDEISQIDNKNIDDVAISTTTGTPDTPFKSGMDSFESTDALLLETDYAELEVFFTKLVENDLGEYKDAALNRFGIEIKSKSSNYATESPLTITNDIVQSGGTFMSYDTLLANRKETPAFCDVSVKQITWPLITSVLLNTGNKDSIYTFIEHIEASTSGESTSDNSTIDLLGQIPQQSTKRYRRGGGDPPDGVTSRLSALTNSLYDIHSKTPDDNTRPNSNTDLMLDVNLGFHPLVPIYAVLAPYFSTLGPKAEGDPFFYTYFTYINILEKMKSVIETKYLNNTNNPAESASAYLIGFGLNTMLIKSHTSILQNNEILKVLDMSQQEYFEFSLKNDSFAGLFSGSVSQDKDEEAIGISLINNKLFTNFINNEVNIKEILQTGTPVINLQNYEVLKDRIFKIMREIVVKVNADRGTPIVNTVGVASGVPVRAKLVLVPPERKTGIRTLQDYPTKTTDTDGVIVNSTSSSTRSGTGGKKSRKNKQKKKKKVTRKQRKTYKNNTKKVHKKHKRTIKH